MAGKRNRILEIKNYLESLGIAVNIGKNKARGNRGVFLRCRNDYRIDVSRNLSEEEIIAVLIHEFAHYLHSCYDRTLTSLDFIFPNITEDIVEELRNITVNQIPKETAASFFNKKESLTKEIKNLSTAIKTVYPEFKSSERYLHIEKQLSFPFNHLLKHDKIKIFKHIYSLENLDKEFPSLSLEEKAYILLRSKKRALARINNKISKLNKYYNNNSELFARFLESYMLTPELTKQLAPKSYNIFVNLIKSNRITILSTFCKFIR